MSTVKWAAAPTSRSTGLTTELNSLADGAFSAVGTAFDNTSNLDQWASVEIALASLSPAAGAYVQVFLVQSLDGTNYEDAAKSSNPGYHQATPPLPVDTTATSAKKIDSPWFRIPPGKWKLVLFNKCGVALAASGSTVTLYTDNDAIV